MIGFAPLSIKNFSELNILTKLIDSIIEMLRGTLTVPVNMKISYCQDSILTSSGNVIITGKGEYVSEIIAHESVEFINPTSVARGGVIKAKMKLNVRKLGVKGAYLLN